MRLRTVCPSAKVIFVTGYDEYAVEAYRVHAHGYVLKPLEPERVAEELSFWAEPGPAPAREPEPHKLTARCFGQFEVFWEGTPLAFDRRKTKELLAFLIDKEGASSTAEEVSTALWEEEWDLKVTKNRIRVLVSDLKASLDRIGMGELLIRRSGQLAVRRDMVDCDYYRMLEGDSAAINSFDGQYMQQYPWAPEERTIKQNAKTKTIRNTAKKEINCHAAQYSRNHAIQFRASSDPRGCAEPAQERSPANAVG